MRSIIGLLALAWLVCAGVLPSFAQESQARFAFVVGNDGYENAQLPTAANDAALVADALKAARFDVTGARNLDQDTLRASYREFLAKVTAAGPGAVSVVYLSGYGLQFDGENYFVPPGASIARDADVSLNAIRLSDLIRPLSGAPGRGRIVLLDLAYASPFDKQIQGLPPGLTLVEPEAGTIIGFNAAPGVWARPGKEPYGPYAQALGEMLREPGLPIEEILVRVRTRTAELTKAAQVPWSAGKIDPPLLLLERAADAPAPAVAPDQIAAERARPVDKLPEAQAYAAVIDRDTVKGYEDFVAAYPQSPYTKNVRGLLAARREARTWRRSLDLNTQNAYWSYLKRYPRGPHAADARRRLTRLQAAIEPPPVFDAVAYDDPPPPPVEEVYFAGPQIDYYDDAAPPLMSSVFVAAPPPWYQPPPAPVFDDDDDFFLPEIIAAVTAPAWIAPPPFVLPPPQPLMMETRPPGWRPLVAIPAALAVGLAAGRLSNRFLENRRQNLGAAQPGRPPRPPILPAITAPPKGVTLPAGVRPGQPFVRPAVAQPGQPLVRPVQPGQPLVRPVQPGQVGAPNQPVTTGRPPSALPNLPVGQPPRPGQAPGQAGAPVTGSPLNQPGLRPGQAPVGAGQPLVRPGGPAHTPPPALGARPGGTGQPVPTVTGAPANQPGVRPGQPTGQPLARPVGVGQPATSQPPGAADRRQQMIQQQQQRQEQLRQQQQQRVLQQQQQRAQQQQMQEQRARQSQQLERSRQQSIQQQQQRQQILQQQQRQNQFQQQQRVQQQQRQQQLMQQQRQQQLIQQQQRQQQMIMQQQRQQQMIIQQQRQQQMMQQQQRQQQQQRRPCGLPGLPRC